MLGYAGINKRTEERSYETEHDEVEYVKERPGICGMGTHWVGRPVRRTVQIPYQETIYELNRSEIQVSYWQACTYGPPAVLLKRTAGILPCAPSWNHINEESAREGRSSPWAAQLEVAMERVQLTCPPPPPPPHAHTHTISM